MLTGVLAWFCKKHKRPFVFRTAHDTDCIPGKQLVSFWRDRKLYEYGLRKADIIAVQGLKQQKLLMSNYNLRSDPVNMVVEIPPKSELCVHRKDIDVLWVNKMRPFKRPELVIELAKLMPDSFFLIIGGPCPRLGDYYSQVSAMAANQPNLRFVGPVPYHRVNSYFERARVFVNTSESEGFPNSFLQAWVRGVPVVSFFDPDHLIERHNLGYAVSNLREMAKYTYAFLKDEQARLSVGAIARSFVIDHYSPLTVARTYIRLFGKLMR